MFTSFFYSTAVWKRFTSLRTDYRKLKNPKTLKSGQATKKLTNLQKYKMKRYQFLDAHIMPRSYTEGRIKIKTKSIFAKIQIS